MTNYSRSVLLSNGLHLSKNFPVKFGFSPKPIPANIAKKLPPQRYSKPLLIAFFNFFHKRPTFVFTPESEYTLGPAQRIAHNGSHGETGGLPSLVHSAALCCQRYPFYSTTLLYTYISRFSVNPQHQQKRKICQSCRLKLYLRPSFIAFFNFSHKCPTFAFTVESGYTLAFANRIAHSGLHAETGNVSDGALSLPSTRAARSRTSPGRVSERQTLPLLSLGRRCSRRTQKAFGTAMRSCASLFRRRRSPAGLRCSVCNLVMLLFFHSVRSTF